MQWEWSILEELNLFTWDKNCQQFLFRKYVVSRCRCFAGIADCAELESGCAHVVARQYHPVRHSPVSEATRLRRTVTVNIEYLELSRTRLVYQRNSEQTCHLWPAFFFLKLSQLDLRWIIRCKTYATRTRHRHAQLVATHECRRIVRWITFRERSVRDNNGTLLEGPGKIDHNGLQEKDPDSVVTVPATISKQEADTKADAESIRLAMRMCRDQTSCNECFSYVWSTWSRIWSMPEESRLVHMDSL